VKYKRFLSLIAATVRKINSYNTYKILILEIYTVQNKDPRKLDIFPNLNYERGIQFIMKERLSSIWSSFLQLEQLKAFANPDYYINLEDASISSNTLFDNNKSYTIQSSSENVWLSNKYHRKGYHSIGFKLDPGVSRRETSVADIPNNTTKFAKFSVFFPSYYPIPTDWNLFAQWWQGAPASPPISFELEPNSSDFKIRIVSKDGTVDNVKTIIHYNEKIYKNQWIDFVVQFRVDDTGGSNGILRVWKNGIPIVNYSGKLGYTDLNNNTNFRFGLYRSPSIQNTAEAFYDEIKLG